MKFKSDSEVGIGGGAGGPYVSLKNGESINLLFCGDPVEFRCTFDQVKKRSTLDPNGRMRFKINCAVYGQEGWEMHIWEQGPKVYQNLRELAAVYDLTKNAVRINRAGEGMDTTYSILPLPPEKQLSAENLKAIAALELNDLQAEIDAMDPSAQSDEKEVVGHLQEQPPFPAAADVPF